MRVLPYVLRRIFWGAISYLLTVAGFLALLNGTLEATIRGEIAQAVNNAMANVQVKNLDAESARALRSEMRAAMERSYGLDRPFLARVAARYVRLLRFDLGNSRSMQTTGHPASRRVADLLVEALPPTLVLFLAATGASVAAGMVIGLRMSRKPGGLFDRVAITATMFFFGTPAWWVASFAVILFVYELRWFPFGALHSVPRPHGTVARLLDAASYLVLPALTIASVRLWGFAYRVRSLLVPLVHTEYATAARGRGIAERRVIGGHVLRVALPGIATQAALVLVDSLCGDILVERVFARPGLGTLLWQAMQLNDVTLAAGILLVLTLLFTATVVLLDITYHLMDPRIRISARFP